MTSQPAPSFGALLRRLREAASLTQAELAERSGLSREGISALERNTSRAPRRDTVDLLADALTLATGERALFAETARRSRATPSARIPASSLPIARPGPGPLVGRTRELELLRQHLDGQGPSVLLLAGEPGIGKTHLLREAAAQARSAGWTVMEGGCLRAEGQQPYAPLLAALEDHVRTCPPALLHAQLRGCSWLVRLLPELADTARVPIPIGSLPPEQERRLIFTAVGRFLAHAAGPVGTLLVLDDLQWAGLDALDLLTALVRSEPERPLQVLGAYRSTEARSAHPLMAALAALARDGLVVQTPIGPLAADEASRLLTDLLAGVSGVDAAQTARILRLAGGVPFYLVSYARSFKTDAPELKAREDVPWDAAESIRQRVDALPSAAQAVLRLAAVIGRPIPTELLLAASGESELEVLDALHAACQARLLLEDGEDAYRFPHDIVREVLEADLSAGQRRILHRRVAEALEQRPGDSAVELLAYHYSRAGVHDKAWSYLECAGDHAQTVRAHGEAEGYYRELVTRLDRLERPLDAARAREKLGSMLNTLARYDDALVLLDQAAQIYRAHGHVEDELRVTAHIGQAHAYRGTLQDGLARVRQVLAAASQETQPAPSADLAMLYAALAHLSFAHGSYEDQLAAAEHAAELARAVAAPSIETEAELRRGTALLMLGRLREGTLALETALAPAEVAGDLATVTIVLNNLGAAYADLGELTLATMYTDRSLEMAERMANPSQIAHQLERRGTCAFYAGEWGKARSYYERAVTFVRRIGQARVSLYPLLDLGRLDAAEGRRREAAEHFDEALALAEQTDDLQALCSVQCVLAELDLLEEAPARARARLEPLLARSDERQLFLLRLLPRLAWARAVLGDEGSAQVLMERCLTRAWAEQMRLVLVDALRIQAILLQRQRRWEGAERALDETLALCRRLPYPYAEAKALYVVGKLHAARGEPDAARARYEAALAILHRLGERLYAERTELALSELG